MEERQPQTQTDAGPRLRDRTVAGVGWFGGAHFVRQAVGIAIGVVLARLLGPGPVGLFAMILVLVGFTDVMKDMGFRVALVQFPDADERHFDSVFWLSIANGLLLTVVVAALAPVVSWFYGEPRLAELTLLISLRYLVDGLGVVQYAKLLRELRFGSIAVVETVATVVGGAVALVMAWLGGGVWSLAAQSLAGTVVTAVGWWWVCRWRPRFRFDRGAVRQLTRTGGYSVAFNVLNYWARNADNLLIGRFLGSGPLGIYSRAYELLLAPLRLGSGVVGRVLFPSMARIQGDRERLGRVYLRIARLNAILLFPATLGLAVVAEPFVLAVFGVEWAAMTPLLRWFGVVGLVQSQVGLNGNLYLATGRTDLQLRIGGTAAVLGVASIVLGLRWGVLGVTVAYSLCSLLVALPSIALTVSLVGLDLRTTLRNLVPLLLASAGMTLVVLAVDFLLRGVAPWPRLLVDVASGVVAYALLLLALRVAAVSEALELIADWRARRGKTAAAEV